jgi:hypothetical protein
MNWLIPLGIVAVLAPAVTCLYGWRAGWWRMARVFGKPPQPSIWVARWAYCIIGLMRLPLHIGASGPGLVISPPFPISLVLPRIWAPWSEISLGGPSLFKREDLDIRGFTICCPPVVAEYVRQRQHGQKI